MNISEIKRIIREWYGALSIEEIILNKDLTNLFEEIEMVLSNMEHSENNRST